LNSARISAKFRSLLGLAEVRPVPTYEYICSAGHAFEAFQKISERPKTKCPTCGKPATRKISGGAGLVFKGSGFYITDYKRAGEKPPAEGDSKPSTETKPATEAKAATESKSSDSAKKKSDSGGK